MKVMRLTVVAVIVVVIAMITASAESAETFAKPAVMRWGSTTAQVERALEEGKLCTKSRVTRPIVPAFLDHVKGKQVQVDCDGFIFLGKPRWVEFVIGDDSLEMVWIMTTKEEEEDIERAMIDALGEPSYRTAEYTAFTNHGAALRFKPAEVLFYSPRVAKEAEGWFK